MQKTKTRQMAANSKKITDKLTTAQTKCLIVIPLENPTKPKIVGTGPTLQTSPDPSVMRKNAKWTPQLNKQPNLQTNQKLITPRLRFGEKVDARAYSPDDPPISYTIDTTVDCDNTPTVDWLRRQALASIKKPFPQGEQEETYTQDRDYRDGYKLHITKESNTAPQVALTENASKEQPLLQTNENDTFVSTKLFIFPDDFPVSLNSIKE